MICFKYTNFSTAFAMKKYIDLSPNIANILELKTIKGSFVIEIIAGIESKANIISTFSINTKAIPNGVIKILLFFLKKKLLPEKSPMQ